MLQRTLPAEFIAPCLPSLTTTVSVAGKRDFEGGERSVNTSTQPQISGLRDQAVIQEARQFGAFHDHYRKSPQAPECVVGPGGFEVRRETGKE